MKELKIVNSYLSYKKILKKEKNVNSYLSDKKYKKNQT